MSASRYVGRVGSLAVAFGVGAAVLSSVAVATADTGSSDSANSGASSARGANTGRAARAATASSGAGASAAAVAPRAAASSDAVTVDLPTRSARKTRIAAVAAPAPAVDSAAVTAPAVSSVAGRKLSPVATAIKAAVDNLLSPHAAVVPAPAAATVPGLSAAVTSPVQPAAAATSIAGVGSGITISDIVTLGPQVAVLIATALAQVAVVSTIAASSVALPSPFKAAPTLVLNGYNLEPANTETVTGYYGRWTYLPGAPSMVQGQQRFNVVDPTSGDSVGTFDALVSRGNGYNYQELLVTSTDSANVGTGAGQVPPVGSLIGSLKVGKFGWTYTAMPTESGDLVVFKLKTPMGERTVPLKFDAAQGIADHTVDNRPMNLANGYWIAPADPTGENLTGTSGILPLYTTVQGDQKFNVLDADGNPVGSFDGVFTTTWDIMAGGVGTQAVMVTATDGDNVGTAAGQVPPVGTVYNIMYIGDYVYLYSSMPDPSGDVVSLTVTTPDKVIHVPLTFIDASKEPAAAPLTAPGGYTFVPVAPALPTGVNGLPPREVQTQGYQQFDVYDANGTKVGRVDADVSSQWDLLGLHSRALMVTGVAEGTAGTGAGDVPPAGSTFNWVSLTKGGLGIANSAVPTATEDIASYAVQTPMGNVALPPIRSAAGNRVDLSFYSPFQTV